MPTAGTRRPTRRGCATRQGLAFHPQTGDLWAVVQERDGLGDNLPSDYLIRVQKALFGWPSLYRAASAAGLRHARARQGTGPRNSYTPDLLFEAHSSALDLGVYDVQDDFPVEMKGGAFVALKGSWNRSKPTGWGRRMPVQGWEAVGCSRKIHDRLLGCGRTTPPRWHGPPALAIAKDGSLLVADDTGSTNGRSSYTGAAREPARPQPRRRHGRWPGRSSAGADATIRPKDGPRLPNLRRSRPVQRSGCVAAALQTIRVTWSALTLPLNASAEEHYRRQGSCWVKGSCLRPKTVL